jgi:hypothetical protein
MSALAVMHARSARTGLAQDVCDVTDVSQGCTRARDRVGAAGGGLRRQRGQRRRPPHDPARFDLVRDYTDFAGRPVQDGWIRVLEPSLR